MPQRRPRPRASGAEFDPEGASYDHATGKALVQRRPLIVPKPQQFAGQTIEDPGSFDTLEWHADENSPHGGSYVQHLGSVTEDLELALSEAQAQEARTQFGNDVYMLLKGKNHPTWPQAVRGENKLGREIVPGPGGRYFSIPKEPQ